MPFPHNNKKGRLFNDLLSESRLFNKIKREVLFVICSLLGAVVCLAIILLCPYSLWNHKYIKTKCLPLLFGDNRGLTTFAVKIPINVARIRQAMRNKPRDSLLLNLCINCCGHHGHQSEANKWQHARVISKWFSDSACSALYCTSKNVIKFCDLRYAYVSAKYREC